MLRVEFGEAILTLVTVQSVLRLPLDTDVHSVARAAGGKVIDGMNNVVTIAGVPRNGEKPQDPVRIKHISIVPREQAQ